MHFDFHAKASKIFVKICVEIGNVNHNSTPNTILIMGPVFGWSGR